MEKLFNYLFYYIKKLKKYLNRINYIDLNIYILFIKG